MLRLFLGPLCLGLLKFPRPLDELFPDGVALRFQRRRLLVAAGELVLAVLEVHVERSLPRLRLARRCLGLIQLRRPLVELGAGVGALRLEESQVPIGPAQLAPALLEVRVERHEQGLRLVRLGPGLLVIPLAPRELVFDGGLLLLQGLHRFPQRVRLVPRGRHLVRRHLELALQLRLGGSERLLQYFDLAVLAGPDRGELVAGVDEPDHCLGLTRLRLGRLGLELPDSVGQRGLLGLESVDGRSEFVDRCLESVAFLFGLVPLPLDGLDRLARLLQTGRQLVSPLVLGPQLRLATRRHGLRLVEPTRERLHLRQVPGLRDLAPPFPLLEGRALLLQRLDGIVPLLLELRGELGLPFLRLLHGHAQPSDLDLLELVRLLPFGELPFRLALELGDPSPRLVPLGRELLDPPREARLLPVLRQSAPVGLVQLPPQAPRVLVLHRHLVLEAYDPPVPLDDVGPQPLELEVDAAELLEDALLEPQRPFELGPRRGGSGERTSDLAGDRPGPGPAHAASGCERNAAGVAPFRRPDLRRRGRVVGRHHPDVARREQERTSRRRGLAAVRPLRRGSRRGIRRRRRGLADVLQPVVLLPLRALRRRTLTPSAPPDVDLRRRLDPRLESPVVHGRLVQRRGDPAAAPDVPHGLPLELAPPHLLDGAEDDHLLLGLEAAEQVGYHVELAGQDGDAVDRDDQVVHLHRRRRRRGGPALGTRVEVRRDPGDAAPGRTAGRRRDRLESEPDGSGGEAHRVLRRAERPGRRGRRRVDQAGGRRRRRPRRGCRSRREGRPPRKDGRGGGRTSCSRRRRALRVRRREDLDGPAREPELLRRIPRPRRLRRRDPRGLLPPLGGQRGGQRPVPRVVPGTGDAGDGCLAAAGPFVARHGGRVEPVGEVRPDPAGARRPARRGHGVVPPHPAERAAGRPTGVTWRGVTWRGVPPGSGRGPSLGVDLVRRGLLPPRAPRRRARRRGAPRGLFSRPRRGLPRRRPEPALLDRAAAAADYAVPLPLAREGCVRRQASAEGAPSGRLCPGRR